MGSIPSQRSLADGYEAFLLDLDGTLYRGDAAIPGAIEVVHRLHERGDRVVFLTNNSGRTREQVAEKLRAFGVEASPDEVVSSALATAEVLAGRGVRSVFAICGEGLRSAMRERGIELSDGEPDAVDAVVVGWDPTADYDKLKMGGLLVQRGAALVASNGDGAFPAPDGLWPGAGALLSVITTTTGASPEIIGKPHSPLFETALERAGGGRPLVVGDRLDTDIAGAEDLGWDSLLVFSGITAPEDLSASSVRPTFVGADIRALFDVARPAPSG
ncbi:MAG: HAD-IIA family hydrolase [Actinomycetota bacterium]